MPAVEHLPINYELHAVEVSTAYINEIAETDALVQLVGSFGVSTHILDTTHGASARQRLLWLKAFSNEYLDSRQGKERDQVEMVPFRPAEETAIEACVEAFHMRGETDASRQQYGFISVLGGRNQRSLHRVRHAKRQFENGVTAPYLLLLGSNRSVDETERVNTANYAGNPETEYDLMNAAFEQEFGVSEYDEVAFDSQGLPVDANTPDSGRVRYYELSNGTKVLSVSAPRIEGTQRTNTADTYLFIDMILGKALQNGGSLLAITSDIFVPFQHADALRIHTLLGNMQVETIGCNEGEYLSPAAYANEINALINQTYLLNEELLKDADYAWLEEHVSGSAKDLHDSYMAMVRARQVNVGGVTLRIALEAARRRAELLLAIERGRFGTDTWAAATEHELSDQMMGWVQLDIDSGRNELYGLQWESSLAYAAVQGIRVISDSARKNIS